MRNFSCALVNVRLAALSLSPTTEGTVALPGPWETVSVTVEPASTLALPGGCCPITVPAFWLAVTSSTCTANPSFWSTVRAVLSVFPVTVGTTRFSGRVSR